MATFTPKPFIVTQTLDIHAERQAFDRHHGVAEVALRKKREFEEEMIKYSNSSKDLDPSFVARLIAGCRNMKK